MSRFFKDKSSSGLGIIEVILALGIMALITPVVLKFSFKELSEVKYINLAKQMRQIEKSLLNFASREKDKWPNGTSTDITKDIKKTFTENYGLDTSIEDLLINNTKIRYTKNDDSVELFAIIDMDKYGFEETVFKQILLYAGDIVGYKDEDYVYSITGAWAKPFSTISAAMAAKQIAVIKVDDNDLEEEYASSNYLYRNNQGGTQGNVMNVDLSLGGYEIKNFGTISAAILKSEAGKTGQIKFNDGRFEGKVDVNGSIILNGKLEATNSSRIKSPLMELAKVSQLSKILLENAVITKSATSLRTEVKVADSAELANIKVQNLKTNNVVGGGATVAPLNDTSRLKLDIQALEFGNLHTNTITVKNNRLVSQGTCVSTLNGRIYFENRYCKGRDVYIYNVCSSRNYKGLPECNRTMKNLNLRELAPNFYTALDNLEYAITGENPNEPKPDVPDEGLEEPPEICDAGKYLDSGVCVECPAGNFCPEASTTPTLCSSGSFSEVGAETCDSCDGGYYSDPGAQSCYVCPAGYYCPTT